MQRHVNHLAFAAVDLAVVQRREHADGAVQGGQRVANRDTDTHRHAAGLARQVAQAAHGLADRAKAGQVAVGPCLAVARNAQHHQAGVELVQLLGRHAPAFERAGAEVFHQHIGLGNQLAGYCLPFGLAQVQRHRALVARLHLPPDGGAFLDQAPVAQRVASLRRLNLDHIGAKLAQRLAAKRPGDQLAHFNDAHALQCSGAGWKGRCGGRQSHAVVLLQTINALGLAGIMRKGGRTAKR